MKAYTNKVKRIDDRVCLFSEIKHSDKARKVANRREAKNEIKIVVGMLG